MNSTLTYTLIIYIIIYNVGGDAVYIYLIAVGILFCNFIIMSVLYFIKYLKYRKKTRHVLMATVIDVCKNKDVLFYKTNLHAPKLEYIYEDVKYISTTVESYAMRYYKHNRKEYDYSTAFLPYFDIYEPVEVFIYEGEPHKPFLNRKENYRYYFKSACFQFMGACMIIFSVYFLANRLMMINY